MLLVWHNALNIKSFNIQVWASSHEVDNDEDDDELGESAKHFEYNLSDFASFSFFWLRSNEILKRFSSIVFAFDSSAMTVKIYSGFVDISTLQLFVRWR